MLFAQAESAYERLSFDTVVWVDAGISAAEIWAELKRREGVSGIAEKRARALAMRQARTRKVW